MVDIETLATTNTAALWQIGAVAASTDWETKRIKKMTFAGECSPYDLIRDHTSLGLDVDDETISWQINENSENYNMASKSPSHRSHTELLADFALWICTLAEHFGKGNIRWWAKGKEFDYPITIHNYNAYDGAVGTKLENVVMFWNIHEFRTVQALAGEYRYPPRGAHTAIVDAEFQLKELFRLLDLLERI